MERTRGLDVPEQLSVQGSQIPHHTIKTRLRMTLPADRAAAVAGLAAAEQRCCPFFGFLLRLDGQVLQLEVRAPADGAGLLFELFGPAA
jgi:hypothetical protein